MFTYSLVIEIKKISYREITLLIALVYVIRVNNLQFKGLNTSRHSFFKDKDIIIT